MMNKPPSCQGCPLHPLSTGFMRPSLAGRDGYGVALVGQELGEDEAEQGAPFVGRAGFRLTRLIEWAGLVRSKFDIWNCCWCRPPGTLDGQEYETGAIAHCRAAHWGRLLERVRVVVPMGNVALRAFAGRAGILSARGYIVPGPGTTHLLPTVHPSFIQRGQSNYSAAFIFDLQKAVELARGGLQARSIDYLIDPPPGQAYSWAKDYLSQLACASLRLTYDIETPGKDEDEGENTGDEGAYFIWRIGFSYKPGKALSVPWEPSYLPTISLLLGSPGDKVVWNASFDNPRIKAAGVEIKGLVHDGMVAWHILHSDLPKGLGFVATFTCPYQPPWKHLSKQSPGFYNATDADVAGQSMSVIEVELRKSGLWDVYQRDVIDLDPILRHMEREGMPVDGKIRYDRAIRLAEKQETVLAQMAALVPVETRAWSPKHGYVKEPKDTTGMVTVSVEAPIDRCGQCGIRSPRAAHFKETKKSPNPCAGATKVTVIERVERWARLEPFTPSREQIIRYNEALNRGTPRTRDKKTGEWKLTTNEKALKQLIRQHATDPFYASVMESRELKRLQGTYIGYPYDGRT